MENKRDHIEKAIQTEMHNEVKYAGQYQVTPPKPARYKVKDKEKKLPDIEVGKRCIVRVTGRAKRGLRQEVLGYLKCEIVDYHTGDEAGELWDIPSTRFILLVGEASNPYLDKYLGRFITAKYDRECYWHSFFRVVSFDLTTFKRVDNDSSQKK